MASTKAVETVEITDEQLVNAVAQDDAKVGVRRLFTIPGRDPFEEIEWESRDALIPGKDGAVFEQNGVEFPKFWSQTATNIVSQKYFRGRMSSPEREQSECRPDVCFGPRLVQHLQHADDLHARSR